MFSVVTNSTNQLDEFGELRVTFQEKNSQVFIKIILGIMVIVIAIPESTLQLFVLRVITIDASDPLTVVNINLSSPKCINTTMKE